MKTRLLSLVIALGFGLSASALLRDNALANAWFFLFSSDAAPAAQEPRPTADSEPADDTTEDKARPTNHPAPGIESPEPMKTPHVAQGDDLAARAFGILKVYCHECHGLQFSAGKLDVADRPSLLSAGPNDDRPYLTPGNVQQSFLWQRLGVERDMPPPEAGPSPNDAEIALVRQWIEQGAPFPAVESKRRLVSFSDILRTMRDDLMAEPAESRPFLRYFVNDSAHNNPALSATDLALGRAAVSKLLNSLSWSSRVAPPVIVDAEQVILRIDLRDYQDARNNPWSADQWLLLENFYPYSLAFDTAAPEIAGLVNDIHQATGTRIAWLRADWFVDQASRPPLYHRLLQLPDSQRDLEALLGVNLTQELLRGTLHRGAVRQSVVAPGGRVLDRYRSKYGWYWISHDFIRDSRFSDFVARPLGPDFPGNPFLEHAFVEAGGEIVFTLPNGLNGYMLVARGGRRLDAGPAELVNDPQESSGSPVIVNGRSCMVCHHQGIIPFEDILRSSHSLTESAAERLLQIVPPQAELDAVFKADRAAFQSALDKAVQPMLGDVTAGQSPSTEPIFVTTVNYGRSLDLAAVVRELPGISQEELQARIKRDARLRALGLSPLLEGGRIPREDWEFRDPTESMTRYQKIAQELGVGIPLVSGPLLGE